VTTVVYRSGVLAGDTRVTSEDTVMPGRERKVFRLPDGSLFAAADDAEGGELLLRAMRKGMPPPRLVGDLKVQALLVKPNRKLFIFEGSVWVSHSAEYYALGTGRPYALGALYRGATAVEAVRAGIEFDAHSGGRIQVVKLARRRA
jgi:ATP-dependent protease HslVU (ClpYQ) peptidase subunit